MLLETGLEPEKPVSKPVTSSVYLYRKVSQGKGLVKYPVFSCFVL